MSRRTRRKATAVAAVLVLFLVLFVVAAACGDDGDDPSAEIDTTTSVAARSTTTRDPGPPAGPPTTRGLPEEVAVEPVGGLGGIVVLAGEPPYQGILGQIDVDRFVVAPRALPPAPVADGIAPLTGLPLEDPDVADRPALVVKLDNTNRGRPQEALALADVIYEEMIEGGFTRLAAVYHTHAPFLGPVRSGRTTDIAILGSLNQPIFAWSGANLVHAALLRRQDLVDLGAGTRREYSRDPGRPGTYNLMTDGATLQGIAADLGAGRPPPPHFEYRDESITLPPSAVPAAKVTIDYPSVLVEWDWIAGAGWARRQDGTEHVDAQAERVIAANVVIAEVGQVFTGSIDTSGSRVNEQQFLGTGRGWVFTDGSVVEVTWTKPSIRSVATWTTADGIPVALMPGQTWVELVPAGSVTVS